MTGTVPQAAAVLVWRPFPLPSPISQQELHQGGWSGARDRGSGSGEGREVMWGTVKCVYIVLWGQHMLRPNRVQRSWEKGYWEVPQTALAEAHQGVPGNYFTLLKRKLRKNGDRPWQCTGCLHVLKASLLPNYLTKSCPEAFICTPGTGLDPSHGAGGFGPGPTLFSA